jgi:(S)-2-hydroxyglutarate dehydrogenase
VRGGAIELADGSELHADRTIVCAGLNADRLARRSGEPAEPRIVPFRGAYRQLRPERADLVKGLIYPVPDPALPFLGIHLTRRVDGSVLIGPNALPAPSRAALAWPGTARLLRRHWRTGAGELRRSASKAAFVREARRYVPQLRAADTIPAPAGVRAQAVDRDGTLVDDFRLGGDGRVIWVRNAPSPGATSSLAIAEELVGRIGL